MQLWGPQGDPAHLARVLFAYDNPPGTECVSGSQDSIGLVVPGLCYSYVSADNSVCALILFAVADIMGVVSTGPSGWSTHVMQPFTNSSSRRYAVCFCLGLNVRACLFWACYCELCMLMCCMLDGWTR